MTICTCDGIAPGSDAGADVATALDVGVPSTAASGYWTGLVRATRLPERMLSLRLTQTANALTGSAMVFNGELGVPLSFGITGTLSGDHVTLSGTAPRLPGCSAPAATEQLQISGTIIGDDLTFSTLSGLICGTMLTAGVGALQRSTTLVGETAPGWTGYYVGYWDYPAEGYPSNFALELRNQGASTAVLLRSYDGMSNREVRFSGPAASASGSLSGTLTSDLPSCRGSLRMTATLVAEVPVRMLNLTFSGSDCTGTHAGISAGASIY
jgi:hypothetical protein